MSIRLGISAVIITRNEEAYIASCLESLKGIADEILVLDSNSTDRTKEICSSYHVRFEEVEWKGYADTKNQGTQLANYSYILSIDADEQLSEVLRTSLLNVKAQLNSTTVYGFNRLNNYCGVWMKRGGWYPDFKIRLFPRTIQWTGRVHETLEIPSTFHRVSLQGDLLHYSIEDKQDHINRELKYASLAAPYSSLFRAYSAAIFNFIKVYFLKGAVLEGKLGLQLAYITSKAKIWRNKKAHTA